MLILDVLPVSLLQHIILIHVAYTRARALSSPYSVAESRALFDRFKFFFMTEKTWFVKQLKARRHGIGFAELNAMRAATFGVWDAALTRKGKARVIDLTDQENDLPAQQVGQAEWDALNAAYGDSDGDE